MGRLTRFWSMAVAAVVAALIACGGSKGPGIGSSLCGINGSNQCRAGQQCDPALGCVECVTSASCAPPTPICILGLGQCGACVHNTDCTAAAPSCWPGDHACHAACMANADCPGGAQICDTSSGVGVCVGCRSSADCVDGNPLCDLVSQRCVECLSNADCGIAQPICEPRNFTCRAGCTSNAQCSGSRPVCNPVGTHCVQCLSNADCAALPGKFCGQDASCVACLSNADCPQAAPNCHGGACVQCFRPKDCPTGQACDNGVCH
jgi:hypothetical protein